MNTKVVFYWSWFIEYISWGGWINSFIKCTMSGDWIFLDFRTYVQLQTRHNTVYTYKDWLQITSLSCKQSNKQEENLFNAMYITVMYWKTQKHLLQSNPFITNILQNYCTDEKDRNMKTCIYKLFWHMSVYQLPILTAELTRGHWQQEYNPVSSVHETSLIGRCIIILISN